MRYPIASNPYNPQTITPGSSRGATINAQIQAASAGDIVRLQGPGTYYVETAIIAKSNITLDLNGGTITASFAPNVSQADVVTNCLIDARGATNLSLLNSTLALVRQMGDEVVTVVASPTTNSLNGYYIRITGNPAANGSNSSGDSDGASVSLYETKKVISNTLGSLSIYPLLQHHDQTNTAQGWTPIENFKVINGTLNCSGGSIAVGINGEGSVGLTVENLAVKGFSRTAIEIQGGIDWLVQEILDLGENNGLLFLNSACAGAFYKFKARNVSALRHHTNGVPRAKVWMRNRCSVIQWDDMRFERGSIGMEIWGGKSITGGKIHCWDMNPDDMITARVANGEMLAGNPIGVTLSGGAAPLTYAEFAHNVTFTTVSGDGFASATLNDHTRWGVYNHDWLIFTLGQLVLRNSGSTTVAGQGYHGMQISDSTGHVDTYICTGYSYGLWTNNVLAQATIDHYAYDGSPGGSGSADYGLYLNHTGNSGFRIGFANIQNSSYPIQLGSSLADNDLWIGRYQSYAYACEVILGYNLSGTTFEFGDVGEPDPSYFSNSVRHTFRTPQAGATKFLVNIVNLAATGRYSLVTILPAPGIVSMFASTAAVNPGDRIIWTGTVGNTNVKAHNGSMGILGQANTYKAAGSVNYIQVGPGQVDLTPLALTSSGASIALDLSTAINFTHTLSENTTLAAPTNIVAGQSWEIVFTQISPAKTLGFNAAYNFLSAGAPTISVTNGKKLKVRLYSPDGSTIIAWSIQDT